MICNNKGFTLIEMMIVLLVISVLLFITIPNVTEQSSSIHNKGCEAFIHMVEAQVEAFKIEHNRLPSNFDELKTEGYITEKHSTCPNGQAITIDTSGNVTSVNES